MRYIKLIYTAFFLFLSLASSAQMLMKPVWKETSAFDALTGNGPGFDFGGGVKANSLVGGIFWRPSAWYDDRSHSTYISGVSPNTGGISSLRPLIYRYSHADQNIAFFASASSISPNETDTHQRPAMVVTNSGKILIAREDGHITPIYPALCDTDSTTFRELDNFGSTLAYPQLFYLGDTLFCITRTGNYDKNIIHYSTDDGNTWGGGVNIADVGTYWAYPISFSSADGDIVYHHIIAREGADGEFFKLYVMKSSNGFYWTNLNGTYSQNINSSILSESLLNTYYLIDEVSIAGNEDMLPLAHYIEDSTNYYYMVYEDDEEGLLKFLKYEGVSYSIDTIQGITNNTGERGYMGLLVKNSAGGFDYFHNESDASGTYAIRKYQTFDDFQTISGPDYIGESRTQDYNSIIGLGNWVPGLPFLVIANRIDENDLSETDTFIYQYWP